MLRETRIRTEFASEVLSWWSRSCEAPPQDAAAENWQGNEERS
jgi:hypothetical protein